MSNSSYSCPREQHMVDMDVCGKCRYKRQPEDISNIWCTYTIKQNKKRAAKLMMEKRKDMLKRLIYKQEILFRAGRTADAEKLYEDIKKIRVEMQEAMYINKAVACLAEQATAGEACDTTKQRP